MKAVTANLLHGGRVVYLGTDGSWADSITEAALFEGEAADAALAAAERRATEIAGAYLIEATPEGPAGREALRERIRNAGPTVRADLGKQAGDP